LTLLHPLTGEKTRINAELASRTTPDPHGSILVFVPNAGDLSNPYLCRLPTVVQAHVKNRDGPTSGQRQQANKRRRPAVGATTLRASRVPCPQTSQCRPRAGVHRKQEGRVFGALVAAPTAAGSVNLDGSKAGLVCSRSGGGVARADLLLGLVESALAADHERVRRVVEALATEERAKKHTVLAEELGRLLDRPSRPMQMHDVSRTDGLVEILPKRRLQDLQLPDIVLEELWAVVEEQHRAEVLRAYNLEPRHRILLVGPPGNGKTATAEALASELSVPLMVLRYESVITSYLGETSAKIGRVLEDVRRRHCVLFMDEFDTLAKERGDQHDTGEIKRVVSTLLLQLDQLPSHVVVCAATNHMELLDRAVWRRFQVRVELPMPNREQRTRFVTTVSERLGLALARTPRTLVDRMGPISFAEIEEFLMEVRRRQILSGDMSGDDRVLLDRLLKAWKMRAGAISTDVNE
jgi:SpoVK/Ycf46/Vps4 family AAA+-type ATPase